MQNIPIRTERGSRIRRAFIADSDKVLLSCDYSQIELRILAHITGDEGLCRAFSEDLDIHSATASEVFDVPLSAVTSDLRRMAKAINFGLAYGQGVFGLAESLGISRQEAKEIIDRYFVRFPKVAEYMKDVVQTARDQGYVETVFGRRRYLEDINSQKGNLRSFAERAAINAPIQGTASDLVKLAMISIDEVIPLPLILQVHDELIFEGTVEDCEAHLDEIRRIMESAAKFRVPLRVNASMGKSWEDAH
jgi:DNA polymerase-1